MAILPLRAIVFEEHRADRRCLLPRDRDVHRGTVTPPRDGARRRSSIEIAHRTTRPRAQRSFALAFTREPDTRVRANGRQIEMTTPKSATMNPFLQNNPFDVARGTASPADEAPEGATTYAFVPTGPAVTTEECERESLAIEILIRWGESVLHVAHLTPPRSFSVGETQGKDAPADFFLPEEKLGAARLPLLIVDGDADALLVIPAHATGKISLSDGASMSVKEAIARGVAEPSPALSGAHQIALGRGAKAEIDVGGISFSLAAVNAGRVVAGRFHLDTRSLPYQGLSLLLHAGLLAATALFMPQLAMADEDGMSDEQRYLLATKLETIAEREQDRQDSALAEAREDGPTQRADAPSPGDRGGPASPTSTWRGARSSYEETRDNAGAPLSRGEALRQAKIFGMIKILEGLSSRDPNAPASPWELAEARSGDPMGALGVLWSPTLGEAGGGSDLDLTTAGDGSDRPGSGVDVGVIGTIGRTGGMWPGGPDGGRRLRRAHRPEGPATMRHGDPQVSGRIAPEVIQRIVRQNFGRFRLCYENGLRNNPALAGRVSVRFVIGRDGGVASVANGGSDLSDSGVVSCVTRAFYGLSFPPPESGIVTITYPLMFSPAR
jgi:hypothetical protein